MPSCTIAQGGALVIAVVLQAQFNAAGSRLQQPQAAKLVTETTRGNNRGHVDSFIRTSPEQWLREQGLASCTGFRTPSCVRRNQLLVVPHSRESLKRYFLELQNLTANDNNRSIVVRIGDSTTYYPGVLSKARLVNETGMIHVKLNDHRHFARVPVMLRHHDRPFPKKRKIAVWRGGANGPSQQYMADYNGTLHQRVALIRQIGVWSKSSILNVAVSNYNQLRREGIMAEWGGKATRSDARRLLNYQMIIVVEGNDVATAAKWVLSSNSVAIMPPPTKSSWAAEELLVPWTHYIPVRPDFTDLELKAQWCIDNQGECEQIAMNSRCRMASFWDLENEERLIRAVLEDARKRVEASRACDQCDSPPLNSSINHSLHAHNGTADS